MAALGGIGVERGVIGWEKHVFAIISCVSIRLD